MTLGISIYRSVPSFAKVKAALSANGSKKWNKRGSQYTKSPQRYSQEEIKKERDNTIKVCISKFAVKSLDVARKRRVIENRKVKLSQIEARVKTCQANLDSLTARESKLSDDRSNLEKKAKSLKERSFFREFCDLIIKYFRPGALSSAQPKFEDVDDKLEAVRLRRQMAEVFVSLTSGKLEKENSKQLADKEEFFGRWDVALQCQVANGSVNEIAELENDIVKKMALIVEEDENEGALGADSKFQKQWNETWERLLNGRQISDGGKLVLEKLRDKRWSIICDRVQIVSKKNRQSKLQVELNSVSDKRKVKADNLKQAEIIRDKYQVDYKEASKSHTEKKIEAGKVEEIVNRYKGEAAAKGHSSDVVRSDKLKAKLAEREKNATAALKAERSKAPKARLAVARSKVDESAKKVMLVDANSDVEDLRGPSEYMTNQEKSLIDEIKRIGSDIDDLKEQIKKDQIELMVEQQKYIIEARGGKAPDGWKAVDWSRSGYR